MKTRFVLIETSHAGNVGAAARAIKTMGFDELVLVRPRWPNVLRKEETIQRASGALDVLANCRIVETVDEALDGMSHLCATAMTPRDFGPPARTPREHFALLLSGALRPEAAVLDAAPAAETEAAPVLDRSGETGVAFLFGCERYVADAFGVERTKRGTVADVKYATADPKVFACGDMRRGQSLVVWALREGRDTAAVVDEKLMGYTNL